MNPNRSEAAPSGLLASLRRLLGTVFELAQVRLELIGTELEEQKIRILDALVWAAVGAMMLGVGLTLFAVTVVVMFGEGYRVHALVVLTLAFLVGGAFLLRLARTRLQTPGGAFAASAAELAQDRAALASRAESERRPP
jgi:uncharacterized membrane protein YqjE